MIVMIILQWKLAIVSNIICSGSFGRYAVYAILKKLTFDQKLLRLQFYRTKPNQKK